MTDISDLVTALGGDAHVLAFYDARAGNGITLDGGGKLATWDDARGPSGFGPQRVAFGSPGPDVVSGEVICDGSQNYYATAASPIFDLSTKKTVIWIATLPSGTTWPDAWTAQDDPLSVWDSIGVYSGTIGCRLTGKNETTRVAAGTARRLLTLNYGGPSTDPNGGDTPKWVQAHSRLPSAIDDSTSNNAAADRQHSVGRFLDRANYSPTKERAMIVVDHPLSVSEKAAVIAWATTYHAIVEDVGLPSMTFDGNSLTEGVGASDPPTTSYPAKVMVSFPGYEYLNAGVPGRTGATQLAVLPTRILPLYTAARGINAYVYWEGINDLYHGGLTGTQAYNNTRDACLAARAIGNKVVVLSCITGVWTASIGDTGRTTYNALIAANWTTFADGFADVAQIPELSDYTDATYFNADEIHLTDAGYDVVANDPTFGVAVVLASALAAGSAPYTLTADTAAFTLTGTATGLTAARKLTAATAAFALTGKRARLVYSGAPPSTGRRSKLSIGISL